VAVSKSRDDRATRVNDVRRGTREYLSRIRQERKARADHTDVTPAEPSSSPEPMPRPGLMPDPLIARLSQQLVASGLIGAPPLDQPARRDPQRISRPLPPAAAPARAEASGASRISRQYDSALLGMSPLSGQDAKLKVDMSFARPARPPATKRDDLARFAGLEPLLPTLRQAAGANAVAAVAPAAVMAAAPAAPSRDPAVGPLPGIETIPTVGPGIVWRLSQAGIRSMADLAACDAATVRSKLGQIGRLVKVEDWIGHARAVVSGQVPGSATAGNSAEVAQPATSRALCFGRLGESGMAAVTDGKGFGAANCPVAGAVVVLDGWFVAVLEGAPHQVTRQLGHLINNPEIADMALAAWEPIERRRLLAAGVQIAAAAQAPAAGFDPRTHSAVDLMELVFAALSRN